MRTQKPPITLVRVTQGAVDRVALFDERPLTIGSFRLTARTADAIGSPSLEEWTEALTFSVHIETASPYWIGDLLRYADSRAEWREKLDQAISVTGLSRQRLLDLGYLCRHVESEERELAPTVEHARAVAPLQQPAQRTWLDQARTEGWTAIQMRKHIKASRVVASGQASTMHTVDVTVRLVCEADTSYGAEMEARALVQRALQDVPHAHVIGAHAAPHVGTTKKRKAG